MRFLSSLIFLNLLSACSLYQSDGRKFLEKRAFEYSGASAYENQLSCSERAPLAAGSVVFADERATAIRSQDAPLSLQVAAWGSRPYVCDYGFTSETELSEKISAAVELTLSTPPWAR